MGMYTEAVIKAEFEVSDLDENARAVLDYLFSPDSPKPEALPEHKFFSCPRWEFVGNCSSYYHHPEVVTSYFENYGTVYLFTRFDLKNYDGEIDLFIDWISPYVGDVTCLGYQWYEESEKPELILVNADDYARE